MTNKDKERLEELETINDIRNENKQTTFIAKMADKLEQSRHEINDTFIHRRPYYMVISPTACYGNWKDALFIANQIFKLAGYNPDKYNFDVEFDEYSADFVITITVKEDTTK